MIDGKGFRENACDGIEQLLTINETRMLRDSMEKEKHGAGAQLGKSLARFIQPECHHVIQ